MSLREYACLFELSLTYYVLSNAGSDSKTSFAASHSDDQTLIVVQCHQFD